MKREFIVERNGREFVLYAGLLDEAHSQGLSLIRTELVQAPTADNGRMAIAHATVTTSKGTFTALGDASPDNVSRQMVPHLVRMAETRAKARALRDAINVAGAVAEDESTHEDVEGEISPNPPAAPSAGGDLRADRTTLNALATYRGKGGLTRVQWGVLERHFSGLAIAAGFKIEPLPADAKQAEITTRVRELDEVLQQARASRVAAKREKGEQRR